MQSQSQSLLFISFLLCLATTTILSKTINILSNSNEIVKVVISKSHRSNYIMVEAFTPQYQSPVGASIRTPTSSLSSSIELPFSSTTGHQHRHRPQQGKGKDTTVAQNTKTNTVAGVTTNTFVDPFLIQLSHHHNQHHRRSQSLSTSATTSSSSSSTISATQTATPTHFAYQRSRYGRISNRRLRLQKRLHILKTTLQELELNRRYQN